MISDLSKDFKISSSKRTDILMRRHLIEMGFKPGEIFGEILSKANNAQDDLEFIDLESAKQWVSKNFR